MLPKINRIRKKKDFDLIFKRGTSFKNNLLVLKILKNGLEYNRFGFIVSQKVSKKATVRNKVRRRLSEVAWRELESAKGGRDFVFLSLPGIEKKDFAEINEAASNLLNKTNV